MMNKFLDIEAEVSDSEGEDEDEDEGGDGMPIVTKKWLHFADL